MTNSTFAGNFSNNDGGAISVYSLSTTRIHHSTFVNNSAVHYGGAIFVVGNSNMEINNSIIAQNIAVQGPDIWGSASSYYNIIGSSAQLAGTSLGDLRDAAASPLNLGTLANNGGPTQTIALLPGSVAIDRGNTGTLALPATDQRGASFTRVRGGRVDIGAYEVQPTCPSFPVTIANGDTAVLSNAIVCANETTANNVINLTTGGTYSLNLIRSFENGPNGLPSILSSTTSGTLTINGNGAVIARANNAASFRLFHIGSGGNLTLNNLTLSNGSASYEDEGGGGVYNNYGTLTLNGATVSGNSAATEGGGILNQGIFMSNNSLFSANSTPGGVDKGGGAVFNEIGATATITNSTFSNNVSQKSGGAIYNRSVYFTVTASTFVDNVAYSEGGGISNYNYAFISNSAFSGNCATGTTFFGSSSGGGIFNNAQMILTNSTLFNNCAAIFGGGGISNHGTLDIKSSTITGNTSYEGGGITTHGTGLTIGNSIVAGNNGDFGSDIDGHVTSQGYNLIGNITGVTGLVPSDLKSITLAQLNLGALANNGGPTQTMALLTGSVAIDAGNPGYAPPPTTDQRGTGYARVRGGRIDIGAYETPGPSSLTIQLSLPGQPTPPHASWVTTADVELRPAVGAAIIAGTYTSNTNGRIVMTDLPMGTYTLWVDEVNSLGQSIAITLVAGANSVTMPAMKAGDADGNNLVNINDFSLLATSFGKASGNVGYDARADFDGNALINVTDFSILAANFNQSGVP